MPQRTTYKGGTFAVAISRGRNQRSRHVPISQERLLEIERELAVIVRELDRFEKTRPKKPEQAVQFPWAPPLLLDLEK
jgi:hypothetical protein